MLTPSSALQNILHFTLTTALLGVATLSAHPDGAHSGANYEVKRAPLPDSDETGVSLRWWKGNLHTHTLWSDGDSFPELIANWYKENGYNFLAISDHNVLAEGQKWINPETHKRARGRGKESLKAYLELCGEDWVETRKVDEATMEWLAQLNPKEEILEDGQRLYYRTALPPEDLQPKLEVGDTIVRLKPLDEYRTLFEESERFLMIKSEELTAPFSVHVNATNLHAFLPPQGGKDVQETIQSNIDAVYAQREQTGQPMFPHLNHPNFRWAVTAEDMAPIRGLRFFEVYNGHPGVNNDGDDLHVDTDRLWDIILTKRIAELDRGVVFGLATDDTHELHAPTEESASRPGRGWVMVRARHLTPEHVIRAMEAGDFYASTGVVLHDIQSDGSSLQLEIDAQPGVEYVTQFIGTRVGYDRSSEPALGEDGTEADRITRRYSDDIGEVFAEVPGTSPRYEFAGDEIYVRAKVISTQPKTNRYSDDEEWETAWAQPVVLER